jgi:hypothetical protein
MEGIRRFYQCFIQYLDYGSEVEKSDDGESEGEKIEQE